MRFWLERGIDGLRLMQVNHLYEDFQFRDEPLIDAQGTISYENLDHIYTRDLVSNRIKLPRVVCIRAAKTNPQEARFVSRPTITPLPSIGARCLMSIIWQTVLRTESL